MSRIYTVEVSHSVKCRCDDCLEELHSYHFIYGGFDSVRPDPDPNCPLCRNQPLPHRSVIEQTMECFTCHTQQKFTGRERTIEERRDPTASYELACGHWVI